MNGLDKNMSRIFLYLSLLVFFCACDSSSPDPGGTSPPKGQNWSRDSSNPLVTGNEVDILQMSDPVVIFDGGRYRMWFGSVGSDPEYASIGYTESVDGQAWDTPTVVLGPNTSGSWDDQTVEIPSVIRDDGEPDTNKRYKMWYGGSDQANANLTKIGYAYSSDGITWTRLPEGQSPHGEAGLVMIPGNASPGDYAVTAEPSVVKKDGVFYIWYSTWDGNALVISYATSPDGINWAKYPGNPVLRHTEDSWESGGLGIDGTVAQPTVLWDAAASLYKMWYGVFDNTGLQTYAGIGYAASTDGISWSKSATPVFTPALGSPGEENGVSTGPCVLSHDGDFHLWYAGVDSSYTRVINHAIWRR